MSRVYQDIKVLHSTDKGQSFIQVTTGITCREYPDLVAIRKLEKSGGGEKTFQVKGGARIKYSDFIENGQKLEAEGNYRRKFYLDKDHADKDLGRFNVSEVSPEDVKRYNDGKHWALVKITRYKYPATPQKDTRTERCFILKKLSDNPHDLLGEFQKLCGTSYANHKTYHYEHYLIVELTTGNKS